MGICWEDTPHGRLVHREVHYHVRDSWSIHPNVVIGDGG